jgi:hypothetical protein
LKISHLRRKKIGIFLLLNFLFTTILFSFPQTICNGSCSNEVMKNECCSSKEMTCCDMMDMNKPDSIPCEMEIANNSCEYMIDAIDDFTFLIPKTIDTNIELPEIAHIITNDIEKTPRFLIKSQNTLLYSGPPIYLTISSFLI